MKEAEKIKEATEIKGAEKIEEATEIKGAEKIEEATEIKGAEKIKEAEEIKAAKMRKAKKPKEAATKKPKRAATEKPREAAKPKRGKKKKPFLVIGAILAVFVIGSVIRSLGSPEAGVYVNTVSPQRGDLQESISTSGTVLSEEVKILFAPVDGVLADVNVAAGDSVKAGDLLIAYDMDRMERSLRQSTLQMEKSAAVYDSALAHNSQNQAKLREADTNLEALEQEIAAYKAYLSTLQNQLSESQRITGNTLAAEGLDLQEELASLTPGTEEYEEVSKAIARNNYLQQAASSSDYVAEMQREITYVQEQIAASEEYRARMESQKSSSESAVMNSYDKAQQDAENELAQMTFQEAEEEYYIAQKGVTAEFDGIVTECSAIPGAGVSSGTRLLTLESSQNLKVAFNASKYDIEKLRLGQTAEVNVSGHVYQGEISKINRMAERNESNTPMVGVEIHLLNVDDNIILGMDAKLNIYTEKAENVLLIPVEAINADREGDFVYLVRDGVVVRQPIVCGISTDTYAEVREGLTEEDVVILSAGSNLEEGMKVAVMQEE